MSHFDGSGAEMPEHRPVDDGSIEAALAGATRGDASELALVVLRVRNAVEAVPPPSSAMAAVLAAGFSTEKGELPATAASNVNGPAPQVSGPSKWRKARMKIQGFLAGLGVAGKIALGVGIAAAATTGASATGVLPFSITGSTHSHHHGGTTTAPTTIAVTSTTQASTHVFVPPKREHLGGTQTPGVETPTTMPEAVPTTIAPTPTPTTEVTPTTVSEPTIVVAPPSPPTSDTTPTTEPPATMSITLSCSVTGATQVTCNWSAAAPPVASYRLWRWSSAADYAPITGPLTNTFTFVDNTAAPGTTYTYRVFTTRDDGSQGDFSNRVHVPCCS